MPTTQPSRRPRRRADHPETDDLWRAYARTRSSEIRERLILHYAPLVHFVAARVGAGVPASLDHADLVSFGVIGLIEAVDRFDLSRNVKFETYAIARIRGAMLDEMRALDWVPRSIRSTARRVEHSKSRLRAQLLRDPTPAELAVDLGCDRRAVQSSAVASLVALEEVFALGGGEDGDTVTVLDTVEDTAIDELGAQVEAQETLCALLDAMNVLRDREYRMIWLYYFEGFTLSRIGRLFGVSESRVSQIHSKALRELRRCTRVRALAEANGWLAWSDSDELPERQQDKRRIA